MKQRKVKELPFIFRSHYWISFFFLLACQLAAAQNTQCRYIPTNIKIKLDTVPVQESSISLLTGTSFKFFPESIEVIAMDDADSLEVCFRSISTLALDTLYGRNIETYAVVSNEEIPSIKNFPVKEEGIFETGGVESFGSITRGVTFGNRQNLFVNSALNLQMDGQLSEDLNISAVITDQNIPYQPEGNTQQLRDFDNVYIKLYNENVDVTAGDIVLQNPVSEGYFLKYYKNVQGLSAKYQYDISDKWKGSSSVSGSAAKGQFSSAQITPIEGVQGPYKLRGPNGERFIIVLANSEKVYIDGRLMERGFDRDYVIDYNLGEVTFSSRIVITRFTRIRIDFEYAEQYYGRSNVTANQRLTSDKVDLYLNYYRESDNPNNTLGFSLDANDFEQLGLYPSGQGTIDGADSVGYQQNRLLYVRKDTVDLDGNLQKVYEYSNNPDLASWNVSFTEVGSSNGTYVLSSRTANGKIYQWVSSIEGVKQGNYSPVLNVPTPNKKEMVVAGSIFKLSSNEKIYQETALSVQDKNLYSAMNDNNVGYAWKVGFSSNRPLEFIQNYRFEGDLSYEFDQKNFNPIDRFRSIEYDRNWNYDVFSDSINRSDKIFDASVNIRNDQNNKLEYQLTTRQRDQVVNGFQQHLLVSKTLWNFQITSDNFLLENKVNTRNSSWKRSINDVNLSIWEVNPGYTFTIDHNSTSFGDSIVNTLMHFHSHNFYIQSGDSSKAKFRMDYIRRFDQIPNAGEFQEFTAAEEFKVGVTTRIKDNHRINGVINFRSVSDITTSEAGENIMGKLDWVSSYFDKNIKQQITLSSANTRELRRDFIYIAVPVGEGTHTWRDENQDGIQDLDEFYEAINFDEKNFIRLFSPTDEYLQAFQTTYLHTLDARFPTQWRESGFVRSRLSKFSFNANIRMNLKTTAEDLATRVSPFWLDLENDRYIFARNQQRFTLFYNRNAPGLGFDISKQVLNNKSLLSNGYELRDKDLWSANARLGIGDSYIVRVSGSVGSLTSKANYLSGRDFELSIKDISPEVIVQPGKKIRVTGNWGKRVRQNQFNETGEFSNISEYGMALTWIRQGKGNLNANFQWVDIAFEGDENSFLGYELLEALRPGANQKWSINWQQSLSKGLQLNLQYYGRKSTENRAVHTGTAQLTAYF